jgi:hypothetical protein
MLISVPVFSSGTYKDDNTSYKIPLKMLAGYTPNSEGFNMMFKTFIENQGILANPLVLAIC